SGVVFAETGDEAFMPESSQYTDTFLSLSPRDLKLRDYYTPTNREWVTRKNLDISNMSPMLYPFNGKELLASTRKKGRIFLLDTGSLGRETHQQPLYRNPLLTNEEVNHAAHGFWGAFATWQDGEGAHWLYAPAWGPPHSSIAFTFTNDD